MSHREQAVLPTPFPFFVLVKPVKYKDSFWKKKIVKIIPKMDT